MPIMPRQMASTDLLSLWQAVNATSENPAEALERIRSVPNYDSLRHAFKKSFGLSPREMACRLSRNYSVELGI